MSTPAWRPLNQPPLTNEMKATDGWTDADPDTDTAGWPTA